MPQHIACLTFDFDAVSAFIARGMTTPTPMSRGEFGPDVAVPRLLKLLARYGIETTWFVPGHTIESFPAPAEAVAAAGHEIAHHGWTHRVPASLSREEEEAELVRGNETIRRLTGRPARGYRSPAWDLSPHTIELLLKHGFDYDSSLMGNDYRPYRARQGDQVSLEQPFKRGAETRLWEMPISWSLDDFPHFEYWRTPTTVNPGLQTAGGVLQNFLDDFTYMTRTLDWGVLTYTFHPFVIGRGHRMLMLERLILGLLEQGAEFRRLDWVVDQLPPRAAVAD